MASLKWSDVPPSNPAAERNARGMHFIHFTAASARAPELMLALPYMSWGTHDGMPTLPCETISTATRAGPGRHPSIRPSAVRGESAVGAADDEPESAFTLFESPPRELFSIIADV